MSMNITTNNSLTMLITLIKNALTAKADKTEIPQKKVRVPMNYTIPSYTANPGGPSSKSFYADVTVNGASTTKQASVVLDPAVTDDDRAKGRYVETTGPNTIRLWFAAQPVNIIIESVYLEEVQESA